MKFLRAPFLREHLRWLLSKEKRQGLNKNASKEIYSFSLWDGNKDQADVLESHVKTDWRSGKLTNRYKLSFIWQSYNAKWKEVQLQLFW